MFERRGVQKMGTVVAVWSPVNRQGGTSVTTAMLAAWAAQHTNVQNETYLMMSNSLSLPYDCMYYMLPNDIEDNISELVQLSKSNNLITCGDLHNNTYGELNHLEMIGSTTKNSYLSANLPPEISNIFDKARDGYKITFVDANAGVFDQSTAAILSACDIVVVCMPQDSLISKMWVEKDQRIYPSAIEGKPIVYVSAQHYEYPHYGYKDIQNVLKDDVYCLSLNDTIHKMVMTRTVFDSLYSLIKKRSDDDCVDEIASIYQSILDKIASISDLVKAEVEVLEQRAKDNAAMYLDNLQNGQKAQYSDPVIDKISPFTTAKMFKAADVTVNPDIVGASSPNSAVLGIQTAPNNMGHMAARAPKPVADVLPQQQPVTPNQVEARMTPQATQYQNAEVSVIGAAGVGVGVPQAPQMPPVPSMPQMSADVQSAGVPTEFFGGDQDNLQMPQVDTQMPQVDTTSQFGQIPPGFGVTWTYNEFGQVVPLAPQAQVVDPSYQQMPNIGQVVSEMSQTSQMPDVNTLSMDGGFDFDFEDGETN